MAEYNWPVAEKRTLIGKRISRVDGKDKVSGLSYDAMRIFLEAWEKTGGNQVSQSMLSRGTYAGVYGEIRFDSEGANAAQHVVSVQKGRFLMADTCLPRAVK